MLVFVRTKVAAGELAEKLEARGFASGTLNGDMNQAMRERTIQRLKSGLLDIVVATDVGGERTRRRADHPRHQLRHSLRHRGLYPPHRSYRPSGS